MKLTNFGLNIRLLLTYLFGYKTYVTVSDTATSFGSFLLR
jgi:hypothetical protein